MLVLSRKENERIRLGDSIVLTIVRVSGDKVRLGIQAPPDVLVLRDELETFATAITGSAIAAPELPVVATHAAQAVA
ncbi:MAG: carbon storage regulator [Pirellula sp.]|nr:carbon storage regulator [Pirellula sp.]